MTRRSVPLAAVIILLATALRAADPVAEPTDKSPNELLAVRRDDECERLKKAAADALQEARTGAARFAELNEQGKLKTIKLLPPGEAFVKTEQVGRYAARLELLGEPAGIDLAARVPLIRSQLVQLMEVYRALPGGAGNIGKGMPVLVKKSEQRKKSLHKIDALVKQEKWEEAEAALMAMVDELVAMGVFYEIAQRPYAAILQRQPAIVEKVNERSRTNASEAISKARAAEDAIRLAAVNAMPSTVGGEAAASAAGAIKAMPLAVFARHWKEAQLAFSRCQAWDWAAAGVASTPVGSDGLSKPHADSLALGQEQHRFDAAVIAALVAIIEADAQSASPTDAEKLYPDHLREIAAMAALHGDPAIGDTLRPALEKLAAKSPKLSADVAAYRAATDDLLRWRRRTAAAYARMKDQDYPDLEKKFWQAAGPEGASFGLAPAKGDERLGAILVRAAPDVLSAAQGPLLKQKVSASGILGSRGQTAGLALSGPLGTTYARIALTDNQVAAAAALSADLLAGQLPPLTLEAALALEKAQRNDARRIGGEIAGLAINALTAKFTRLGDDDWGLVRLGPLPDRQSTLSQAKKLVLVACDLTPAWIEHDYYFIELPSAITSP